MKHKVAIEDDHVWVWMGPMTMDFPDEPFWWSIMQRTAEAIGELGSGGDA